MTFIGLYLRMLRYRVAAMVWMFMLLGASFRAKPVFDLGYLWATALLASSYVAATSLNDVADRDIDAVNHPSDRGRPLVTGEATPAQLRSLWGWAAAATIGCGALLGPVALGLALLSLSIGYTYSLPPIRLSYRTYLAPVVLSVAYVLVPYGLGMVVAQRELIPADGLFAGALFALFFARINLKDFRDRQGDARYGRPTLLLRFGKAITCTISGVALGIGNLLLLLALRPFWAEAVVLELYLGALAVLLIVLYREEDPTAEQVVIGIGARAGNGLLISVLALNILTGHGALTAERLAFLVLLALVVGIGLATLLFNRSEVVIGYKG